MTDIDHMSTSELGRQWEKDPMVTQEQTTVDVLLESPSTPEQTDANTTTVLTVEPQSMPSDQLLPSSSEAVTPIDLSVTEEIAIPKPGPLDNPCSSTDSTQSAVILDQPGVSPTTVIVSEEPDIERVFEVVLQDELADCKENDSNDQIFYLPLAIGTSAMRLNEAKREPTSISGGHATDPSSHTEKSIDQSATQSDVCGVKESTTQAPDSHGPSSLDEPPYGQSGSESNPPSFLSSKSILFTEGLLKGGGLSESIVQQFNEIAKLNKNSLRSRRTVRTTTTRITHGNTTTTPISISTDSGQSTGAKTSPASPSNRDYASTVPKRTTTLPPASQLFNPSGGLAKHPIHARFHSDETTPMTRFLIQSSLSPDSGKSPESPQISSSPGKLTTTGGGAIVGSSGSQMITVGKPVTYARSVTVERLPIIARHPEETVCAGGSGVLRSRSAAGSVPHHTRQTIGGVPREGGEGGVVSPSPRSLPTSSLDSQGPSSAPTTSNDGSTSSLPSLSTGESSGLTDALEPPVKHLQHPHSHLHQTIPPTGSDPNLKSDHPKEASTGAVGPSGDSTPGKLHTGTGSATVPPSPSDHLKNDRHFLLLKRQHIMKELIQVEKEYVSSLATLVNVYMIPLKQEKILDDQQVETIFYRVKELFKYHLSFLNTLQMWERTNTVGDKLLDMFSRDVVAACYCSFVENFPTSEKTLEACWNTKSSFQKFCEQRLRNFRSKLPLKALLVQPIQRIPRYELLVKRLIEYTPKDYSDNALLNEAKTAIHRLAVRVNTVHAGGQDESFVDGMKLLERLLQPAERKDPVCIFMFTDQIVFTVAKRRGSQMMKKPPFLRLHSPKGLDTVENIKYKIFHRLGIEAIDFEQGGENDIELLFQHRDVRDRDKKDVALSAEIENISNKLDYRHHELDASAQQMYHSVQQELEDLRSARCTSMASPKNLCVIIATTKESIERYELLFPTAEKRNDWERTVLELKRQLSSVKRMSRFYGALDISRTLSGIQLHCASVVEVIHLTRTTPREVWICAADGYTGYICLLGMYPKPMIYLNTPLAGCNSKITCICSVPASPHSTSRRVSGNFALSGIHEKSRPKRQKVHPTKSDDIPSPVTDQSESTSPMNQSVTEQQPPSESPSIDHLPSSLIQSISQVGGHQDDDSETLCQSGTRNSSSPLTTPPDTPTWKAPVNCSTDETSETGEAQSAFPCSTEDVEPTEESGTPDKVGDVTGEQSVAGEDAEEGMGVGEVVNSENSDTSDPSEFEQDPVNRSGDGNNTGAPCQRVSDDNSINRSSESSSNPSDNPTPPPPPPPVEKKITNVLDPYRATMWLGTEDGSIFIFYASDNIKTNRQRQRITLSSAINSIVQLDVRIFVSCVNGELLVYERDHVGYNGEIMRIAFVDTIVCTEEAVRLYQAPGMIVSDSQWDLNVSRMIQLKPDSEEPIVVRRMLAVAGTIWCASHRFIYVLNSITLKVELSFPLNGNPADPRGIQMMAYGNQTVWLATDNSPRVSLYHATTGEFLMEIDLKPVVLQSLQHCDEIILRHKEACLRITCLTVCKDLLWVGTSAGVIVTVAIPRVSLNSTQSNMEPPQLEVLKQGHIGHVRFLLSLENVSENDTKPSPSTSERPRVTLSSMPEVANIPGEQAMTEKEAVEKLDSVPPTQLPSMSYEEQQQQQLSQPTPSTVAESITKPKPVQNVNIDRDQPDSNSNVPSQHHRHFLLGVRRASVNPCPTIATQMKVISGGDGYEEFITSDNAPNQSELKTNNISGDKDSLNYVLVWDVH